MDVVKVMTKQWKNEKARDHGDGDNDDDDKYGDDDDDDDDNQGQWMGPTTTLLMMNNCNWYIMIALHYNRCPLMMRNMMEVITKTTKPCMQ